MRSLFGRRFYSSLEIGKGFDRRIFLVDKEKNKLSYWNDVPLRPENSELNIVNAVIEIPRYTLAKLELVKDEPLHPIANDVRFNRYDNTKKEFRHWYQFAFFNYGFIPQTWESTLVANKEIENLLGDDDSMDVIEISDTTFPPGSVIPVRIFGIFALIDQGELDWKVIGLNKHEADLHKIFTMKDLEERYPQRLQAIKKWFKYFKMFEGKPENRIFYDEKKLELDRTWEVKNESFNFWKELKEIKRSDKNTEHEKKLVEIAHRYHMIEKLQE